jgi:translation initiation factor 1
MSEKKGKKGGWSEDAGASANPFGALAGLKAALPEAAPTCAAEVEAAQAPLAAGAPKQALVRIERKGRGGKAVTVVEGLGLGADELERWCKLLKGKLGAGGRVEGDALVVQGEQIERVEQALVALGVGKVRRG